MLIRRKKKGNYRKCHKIRARESVFNLCRCQFASFKVQRIPCSHDHMNNRRNHGLIWGKAHGA